MGGGLMLLVVYGAQDIYLTGNPQITFFKVVYRRHTNFAMEAIQQTFNGTIGVKSSTVTAIISRNGDLVGRMWLDAQISSTGWEGHNVGRHSSQYVNWTNNTGHAFVKECEVEIGGQRIDVLHSQWLDVWNELTDHHEYENLGLNKHSGDISHYMVGRKATTPTTNLQIYVSLPFWFSRNPGLALPLIALQYHEVKVKLTTRSIVSLINTNRYGSQIKKSTITKPPTVALWCDYIYLDTDERRRFAQVSHEYLIEQIQRESSTFAEGDMVKELNFNHPVKELIWVIQNDRASTSSNVATNIFGDRIINAKNNTTSALGKTWSFNDYFNYDSAQAEEDPSDTITYDNDKETIFGNSVNEPFGTMKLQLNGQDRFAPRNASYFSLCQPIQSGHKVGIKNIYCYSFALKPEEHQPSGTCNFSRIDNAKMIFTNKHTGYNSNLTVYAINYNILRIMSGMGGLAYSN